MTEPKVDVVVPGVGAPVGLEAKFDDADYKAIRDKMGLTTIDLADIQSELRPRVIDPFVDMVVDQQIETIGQEVKKSSKHRYTIMVPSEGENAILNVGDKNDKQTLMNPGISARTKSHIQLQTNGDMKSMLAMGIGVLGEIPLPDPHLALGSNSGVTVVTDGNAWVDPKLQLNLVSRTKEAHLRSMQSYVRVQADAGEVGIAAKGNVSVGSKNNIQIAAGSAVGFAETHPYGGPLCDKFSAEIETSTRESTMEALDMYSSALTLFQGLVGFACDYSDLSKAATATEVGKLLLDAADVYAMNDRANSPYTTGQVKIIAETGASMSGKTGSVYGHWSAGIASPLSATVIGGGAALKGVISASVWAGAGVSVKTLARDVSVSSDLGGVAINAGSKTKVELKQSGETLLTGDKQVDVTSINGNVFIGAEHVTTVTAGKGDGMGVVAKEGMLYLGTLAGAGTRGAKAKQEYSIMVSKNGKGIEIAATGDTTLVMTPEGMEMKTNSFKFNGKEAVIESDRVLLGK